MGIILFIIGVALFIYSYFEKRALEKYEFENRTDGGVVQFPTFEASRNHKARHNWVRFINFIALFFTLAGVIVFTYDIATSK